jgi:hypothetical protein
LQISYTTANKMDGYYLSYICTCTGFIKDKQHQASLGASAVTIMNWVDF